MKWLLLVFVMNSNPGVANLSFQREIKIESEELCKEAALRLGKKMQSDQHFIIGACIKVKE